MSTLNNNGLINSSEGPTGHSHTINQLIDTGASYATNGDVLHYENDVWVPKRAIQVPVGQNFANVTGLSQASSTSPNVIGSVTVNLEYPTYVLINTAAQITVPANQPSNTALATAISGVSIASIKEGSVYHANTNPSSPANYNNYVTYISDNNFSENQIVTVTGTSPGATFNNTGTVVDTDTYPLTDGQFTLKVWKAPSVIDISNNVGSGGTASATAWLADNDSNNVFVTQAYAGQASLYDTYTSTLMPTPATVKVDADGDSLVTFTTNTAHNLSVGQYVVIETTGTANAWTNATPQKVVSIPLNYDSSIPNNTYDTYSTTHFTTVNTGGASSSITNTTVNFGSPENFNPGQFMSVTQSETAITGSHQRTGYLIKYLPKGTTIITLNAWHTFSVGSVSFNNSSMHVIPLG